MPKLTAENSTAIRNTIEILGRVAKAEINSEAASAVATAAVDQTNDLP